MGRKSSVRRLPPAIAEEVNALLSGGRVTLDELLAHLRSLGVSDVSRSALGRHKKNLDKVLERVRQGREIAEAITRNLGPEAKEGRQGRSLVQLINTLTQEYAVKRLEDPDKEVEAKELLALARAAKDATLAARASQDFEERIRERAEKEALAKMEKAAAEVSESSDLSRLSPRQAFERMRAIYRGEA